MAPTTILIRHADVPSGAGSDPGLSEAGFNRARALRHVLRDAGIGSVFVTQFRRTQETAKPLALDLGITPTVIDDVDPLVAAISALPPDSCALVVGHTNTLPRVIVGLGGPAMREIRTAEFDNLFVQSPGRLIHLRYGA